ncbi:MAG: thioredoxin family protein [Gemmatimonadota bacterium]
MTTTALDFKSYWEKALPWPEFLRPEMKDYGLWEGVSKRAAVADELLAAAQPLGPVKLLVIAEDWCGDAANTVPVMARLAEKMPGWEIRILLRDTYPDVMDRYLTNGSRSIPIVIGLDPEFRQLGYWGPRPGELQAWVMANKATMPKDKRYAEVRRWYAKDKGETTVKELIACLTQPQ